MSRALGFEALHAVDPVVTLHAPGATTGSKLSTGAQPMKRFDEYVPALPSLILAALSAVMFGAARWLQAFDDDRPDLGGE